MSETKWDYLFYSYKANLPLDKNYRSDLDKLHKAVNTIIETELKEKSRVGQVAFLHQENQLLKKENARLKKVDRFVVEVFNRLKERAEFDRARAETDLKILEKWRKDYLELIK